MAITNTANFDYSFRGTEYSTNASATVEQEVLPVVTMTKTATPAIVYPGDVVTYFVTVTLGDFTGQLTGQVFSDIIPEELEFVPDSLTVDTVPTAGSPEHIDVMWEAGSEHLLVYQCRVL